MQMESLDNVIIKLDIVKSIATIESQMMGEDGQPLFSLKFDSKGELIDEPVSAETVTDITDNVVPVSEEPEAVAEQEAEPKTVTEEPAATTAEEPSKDEEEKKTETPAANPKTAAKELQRNIAIKVLMFFVTFVFVDLVLFYVYSKLQEESIAQRKI